MTTLAERELRTIKITELQTAEEEFQADQRQQQARDAKIKREREALEAQRVRGLKPANVKFLLVAKCPSALGGPSKFSVVGFYSTREKLAEGLGGAVMAYTDAGQSLGTVDFDLSTLLDQPARPPQ